MAGNRGRSSSSHQEDAELNYGRQSKRRRVAEPDRKRVAKACLSCRRLKEKCDGSSPCGRCVRYRRACGTSISASEPSNSSTASPREESTERLAYLETITRHFLGDVLMDTESLKQVVADLNSQAHDAVVQTASESDARLRSIATGTFGYSTSQLSDAAFAHRLHSEAQDRLKQSGLQAESEYSPEQPKTSLLSFTSIFRRESLPPKTVAMFLVVVYFEFAQTTTLIVEQPWVDDNIERLYSTTEPLSCQDHPWICSVLSILAIGVRYAHLAYAASHESTNLSQAPSDMEFDREASVRFYQSAAELVPDALLLPCVHSMQAFVLLAQFALMWNETSQTYGYLGAALRIAAQIDVEDSGNASVGSLEEFRTYERLCQVAHAWDRRIGILYGIPLFHSGDMLDLKKLLLCSADTEQQQISLDASTTLFAQLTSWLATFAQLMSNLHKYGEPLRSHSLDRLLDVRCRYKKWWSGLNISRIPILQLNRKTAPLQICHHMNLLFMGRSFAFHEVENGSSIETQNAIAELVDEAEYSAYEIIDICAMLGKSAGLSGLTYIESSACRAAVFVMLAQSLVGRCHLFRGKLQEGLALVRKMANVTLKHTDYTSKINAINDEIEKLAPHRKNQKYKSKLSTPVDAGFAYSKFQEWARAGSKRPNTDLSDLEVLIRGGDEESSDLQNIFDSTLLDSSLFAFDSTGFNELDQGFAVY